MRAVVLVCCVAAVGCGDASASMAPAVKRKAAAGSAPKVHPDATAAPVDPGDPWPSVSPPAVAGDRIYSKVRHHWIRPRPFSKSGWIGYLSMGDSVRVKGGDANAALMREDHGKYCKAWYAIEPVGYVCTGPNATLDAKDPDIVELQKHAADRSSPWPYRYAESLNTPVYHQLPSRAQQRRRELGLAEHLAEHAFAPLGTRPPRLLDLPPGGMALQSRVVNGSTVAYTSAFDHGRRSFVLTWDRGFAPKDKLKDYPQSTFHGVVLGNKHKLPIAFFRGKARPKYRRSGNTFKATTQTWPRLAWVGLTGRRVGEHLETREPGMWCLASDASVAARAERIPVGVQQKKSGRRTWLDISIRRGTLVAYEHHKPVYATLISPGRGGVPTPGVDPLKTASTPTGNFNVLAKFVTATMVSGSISTLIHAEVQYTQNINGPYALHGAYWHDDWGEKKSGGCVNLSPIDSQRIFEWTDPQLPEGWHGMRSITSSYSFGDRTLISLHP